MQTAIRHTVFFNHPAEDVWAYITKPELIAQWLMKSDFQPIVGHQFRFSTFPMPNFGFDGTIYCEVKEVSPFTRLSYTWRGGPGDGTFTLDSLVEWTLHEKGNGTELELCHSGFTGAQNTPMFSIMSEGWLRNMNRIGDLLGNRPIAATDKCMDHSIPEQQNHDAAKA